MTTAADTNGDTVAWPASTSGQHGTHYAPRPRLDWLADRVHAVLIALRERYDRTPPAARHRDDRRPPLARSEQHIDITGEVVRLGEVAVPIDDQRVTVAGYSPLTAGERLAQAPHHWGRDDHYLPADIDEKTGVLNPTEVNQ